MNRSKDNTESHYKNVKQRQRDMSPINRRAHDLAKEFLSFNDESPSSYHAAASVGKLLEEADFIRIKETEDWSPRLKPNGRYYFTREGSSLVAFTLDENFGDPNMSMALLGAHTDSPCFKIKPVSTKSAMGYLQIGVECYGGGLWHTWFDRDLTVAGRVAVRTQNNSTLEMRLVHIKRPLLRIPNLAIHLQKSVNTEGFKANKERHTVPIFATEIAAGLNSQFVSEQRNSVQSRHCSLLINILAQELDVDPTDIVDLDLSVSDTQPSAVGGALNEFVFAPRLDNLGSCFTLTKSLINSLSETSVAKSAGCLVKMISMFDHEEVGSKSTQGASSPLVQETIERITSIVKGSSYYSVVRSSMMCSVDMAHAVHPNYAHTHEDKHRPVLGSGMVVKTNQNQRYATSGITGMIIREVARRAGDLPIQEYVVPNDKPCGTTIGPTVSTVTGLRTVDLGQSMLSMHSVREMASVADFYAAECLLRAFFTHFKSIDAEITGFDD